MYTPGDGGLTNAGHGLSSPLLIAHVSHPSLLQADLASGVSGEKVYQKTRDRYARHQRLI